VITHQIVKAKKAGSLSEGSSVLLIVAIAVATLGIGKYGQSGVIAIWGRDDWSITYLIMPLGISYSVFRLLQYAFDHVRGTLDDNSFLRLAAFVMFIPTFPAGPIETYQGFYSKRSLGFDRGLFYTGLRRIALGYFKKIFVVNLLFDSQFVGNLFAAVNSRYSWSDVHSIWSMLYVISAFVRSYFDLAAYSDLAIGFSGLFGFRIMENFNKPFWKSNLAEFWRSWHISLSSWCRNNVYFPVFGFMRKPWLGLYAAMLIMGIWHYVSLKWILWGLYHGTGLVIFSCWDQYKKTRWKTRVKHGKPAAAGYERFISWLGYPLTFLYVALGYSFVSTRTSSDSLDLFYHSLVGR